MPPPSPAAQAALAVGLAALPALFLLSRALSFPGPPEEAKAHAGLWALPADARARVLYPADAFGPASGADVELPLGRVRYWLLGPEDGERVVLLHGISTPAILWKDVAQDLAAGGYRVLLYDMYGRGWSAAPCTTYTASLYTTQLALLLQHLRWPSAHVAGVSMGGGVAAAFAAAFPTLVDRLALLCPTGVMGAHDLQPRLRRRSAPLVQAVIRSTLYQAYLRRQAGGPGQDPIDELGVQQSLYLPGYNHAIASSLRYGPVRGLELAFASVGSSGRPVLLLWGTADTDVPYRLAGRVQGFIPQAVFKTIEGGPHDITLTHPSVVSETLAEFFAGGAAKE